MATDAKSPKWVFITALILTIAFPLSVCLGGYIGYCNTNHDPLEGGHLGSLAISLLISGTLPSAVISMVLCLIICVKRPEFRARIIALSVFLNLSFYFFAKQTAAAFFV